MSLRTKCPHCDREAVLVAEALGKNVRCKGCSKTFTARPSAKTMSKVAVEPEMRGAVKAGAPTALKTRARPLAAAQSADEDPPARSGPREESETTLWIGLGAIGFVTVLASVLVFVLIVNRHPQVLAHAPAPPPAPAPVAVKQQIVEPAPVVKAPPREDPKPKAELPAKLPPKADPVETPKSDPALPPAMQKKSGTPPGLYGTQGSEPIAAAAPGPDTFMRARAEDSFYSLSNARVAPYRGVPRGSFVVNYRIVERGKLTATNLIIRHSDGKIDSIAVGDTDRQGQGTFTVTKDPTRGAQPFPEDYECFLVRIDTTFGSPYGIVLVSNVVRVGDAGAHAQPRNWTSEEIARFTKAAPSGLRENAFPDIGVDTPFAGTSTGLIPRRYVDPKAYLLGLEYRVGSWNGESCLSALRPIYSQDQNKLFAEREIAKEGYAVSGASVQVRNNIDAVQLHYRRIKPDGSLDPTDSYQGSWLVRPDPTVRVVTLGDAGPRPIGLFTRSGAVVDGMALVLESK